MLTRKQAVESICPFGKEFIHCRAEKCPKWHDVNLPNVSDFFTAHVPGFSLYPCIEMEKFVFEFVKSDNHSIGNLITELTEFIKDCRKRHHQASDSCNDCSNLFGYCK